jgi:hypothetical protein
MMKFKLNGGKVLQHMVQNLQELCGQKYDVIKLLWAASTQSCGSQFSSASDRAGFTFKSYVLN